MSDSDADDCWQPAVFVTDEVEEVREGEREESKYSEEEDVDRPEDDSERVEVVEVPGQVVGLNCLPQVEGRGHGADGAHQEVEVGPQVGGQGGQGQPGGQAGGGAEEGGEGEVEAVRHQDHGDDVGRHEEVLIQLDDAGGQGGPVYHLTVVQHGVVGGVEGGPLDDLTVLAVLHGVVVSGQLRKEPEPVTTGVTCGLVWSIPGPHTTTPPPVCVPSHTTINNINTDGPSHHGNGRIHSKVEYKCAAMQRKGFSRGFVYVGIPREPHFH